MIETHSLTKTYSSLRGSDFLAVDDIHLKVEKGDIFGFLGPNGAGKTTTIRMLTTIMPPTKGTATVCGFDVIKDPLAVKCRLGFMPERPGFYETMSAFDNLLFYAEFYGIPKPERRKKAKWLLDEMELHEFANRKVKTFSHGMRKKLALAQAIINDPDILILDEPTGGLDPQGTVNFRKRIQALNKEGMTVFLSSHILPEVQQTCNKVAIINRGKLLAQDTIDNLSKSLQTAGSVNVFVVGDGMTPELLEKIRQIPGIKNMYPYGLGMNFVVDANYDASPEINHMLVSGGARIRSIQASEPSLEEVFLKITGSGGDAQVSGGEPNGR